MPKQPKPVVPPVNAGPDPAAAENAFTTLLPRLRSLPDDNVITLNTDLQDAAIRALAVARFLAEPEPMTRFGLLSPKLLDPQHITDLAPMALAAYHASNELRSARATSSEAKIPVDLADDAIGIKARMLKLAEYAFQSDAVISLEVADIRLGSGYKDLANDLVRLAKIYVVHQGILSKDAFTYRATDADDARKLAQRILTELGKTHSVEETKWIDLSARAWTLLRNGYDEVQAAGSFLYRHEEAEKKFPSLYGASRGRPRKDAAGTVGEPVGDIKTSEGGH